MSSEHLGPMVAYLEALLILWRDYSSGRVFLWFRGVDFCWRHCPDAPGFLCHLRSSFGGYDEPEILR